MGAGSVCAMNKAADITVVVSTFDDDDLSSALKSLSGQTYKKFKVVLINDGGRDVAETVKQFSNLQIEYVSHKQNKGLAVRLNEAIDMVDTEFIARFDADDFCLPERLEVQRNHTLENGLDLIGCATISMAKGGSFKLNKVTTSPVCISEAALVGTPLSHPTYFGRSEVFRSIRYDERFKYSQDYDFVCRTLLAGFQVGNCPEALLVYQIGDALNWNKILFQIRASNAISDAYRRAKSGNGVYSVDPPTKTSGAVERFFLRQRRHAFSQKDKFRKFMFCFSYFVLSGLFSPSQRKFNIRNFVFGKSWVLKRRLPK